MKTVKSAPVAAVLLLALLAISHVGARTLDREKSEALQRPERALSNIYYPSPSQDPVPAPAPEPEPSNDIDADFDSEPSVKLEPKAELELSPAPGPPAKKYISYPHD